jgi:hypothetical protein
MNLRNVRNVRNVSIGTRRAAGFAAILLILVVTVAITNSTNAGSRETLIGNVEQVSAAAESMWSRVGEPVNSGSVFRAESNTRDAIAMVKRAVSYLKEKRRTL